MTDEKLMEMAIKAFETYAIGLTKKEKDRLIALARIGASVMPRPIEEAPKDGTHILGFFDDDGITPPTTLHWFGPLDLPGLRGGGWYVSVQDTGSDRRYFPKRFTSLSALPKPNEVTT